MRIAHREFKPTLAGTLATLVLLPVLVSLGFWQLRRADEKRALIQQFQIGSNTTQLLNAGNERLLPRLQEVTARGRYDAAHQVLLDNMPPPRQTAGNGPGYEVLTPFKLDDGALVLVNRGWVPLGARREQLPKVDVGDEARSIRGRLAQLPQPGLRMQARDTAVSWPRVLNYPSMDDMRKLFGDTLLAHIVLLDADEPDGYLRDWSARLTFAEFGPDRHIAYAVQWFGLAGALLVIYLVVSLKRP